MIQREDKFYVTTPIYYVTAKPHLGSLYSTIIADVLARWNAVLGKKIYMLTGTDEHGQKIAQAALRDGKKPQEFVDGFISAYKHTWHAYEIAYTDFIRTTEQRHVKAVQKWLELLEDKGDIYKSFYKGWYCIPCERFVSEMDDLSQEANGPLCDSCNRSTTLVSEETYFFKLSAYQEKLLDFYAQNPDFVTPKERLTEVINFVKAGLKDLSISRTTINWGIPFPRDKEHVTYVWADALNNYITAIGYGQPDKEQEFSFWWPADMHVLGKDIIRFHAIYWPAFLMATGLSLPKKLLVHGWIKVGQQKMSKSLGNVVDPMVLLEQYGAEQVRYYLMRYMAITHDGEFSEYDLAQKINTDLANDLGNLLNRVVSLAEKYGLTQVNPPAVWSDDAIALRDQCLNLIDEYTAYMEDCLIHMALARVWKCINQINAYFHAQQPWKYASTNPGYFKEIISATLHSLRLIGLLIWPVMPHKMETLFNSLGVPLELHRNMLEEIAVTGWNTPFICTKIPALFTKIELDTDMIENKEKESVTKESINTISIEDFAKVDILVGTIEDVQEVAKSEKLFKLRVNFGSMGMRQILSGIRQFYTKNDLIGRQALFVHNLKPRKMLGLISEGMMVLAQDNEGKPRIVAPEIPVPNGTKLG